MLISAEKIQAIKLLAFDVDGVMTDNHIWMVAPGEWRRQFSIRDGYGIQLLIQKGYQVAFITGSRSDDVKERAKVLKINYFYEGSLEKMPAFDEIKTKSGFSNEQILYMGDDYFDLPLIELSGFGVTVPEANEKIKNKADYVTHHPGGKGAVREICELVLEYGKI